MTVTPLTDMTDTSLRGRWQRRRRIIVPALVALAAFGAFLLWGPIGLGNGPLSVQMTTTQGSAERAPAPVGLILPMYNSGSSVAVVNAVDLVGGPPLWSLTTRSRMPSL